MHTDHNAFTLIELLITLVIFCLLSLSLWPSFKNQIEAAKARSVAYDLQHILQFARTMAIEQRKTISLCASLDGNHCQTSRSWANNTVLIFYDDNHDGLRSETEAILRKLQFRAEGALFWRSFGNKAYLQWQANGMTYYQNGHFLYCPKSQNLQHAFRLVLNVAGRTYFANDANHDGIVEGADGKNISCP